MLGELRHASASEMPMAWSARAASVASCARRRGERPELDERPSPAAAPLNAAALEHKHTAEAVAAITEGLTSLKADQMIGAVVTPGPTRRMPVGIMVPSRRQRRPTCTAPPPLRP